MEKKTITTLICWLLIAVVLPITIGQGDPSHVLKKSVSFDFSKPLLQKGEGGLSVNVEEANSFYLYPGKPVLPVYIKVFIFPFGTKIDSVTCKPSGIHEITIDKRIVNCPLPVQLGFIENYLFIKDYLKGIFKNYNQCGLEDIFPDTWCSYRTGSGLNGDERVVFLTLAVYPVRYHQRRNLIQYAENVEISIEYTEPKQPLLSKKEYDMIIIAPPIYSDELQPLIDYKNRFIKTRFFNLDEIPTAGRDKQEHIKYFIKYAIEEWGITYVLLVGGDREIPVRMAYVDEIRDETCYVSDLYYADIYNASGGFSSWDTNENNRFAEYKWLSLRATDKVDLYPDVYLGRLPCVNEDEVKTCVNKIIAYESNKAYAQDWFYNLVTVGGDTFPLDLSGIDEGECINQAIIETMQGFTHEKIWASNGKLYSSANINSAIEKGAGFVSFDGHSTASHFYSFPHRNHKEWIPPEYYKIHHIEKLSNGDKLPIITFNSCHPCKFTVNHTCLGWSFISNPDGGGIAAVGMTSSTLTYPGWYCTKGMGGLMHLSLYQAYIQQSARTFGELWCRSITKYINLQPGAMHRYDYKIIESWQPFGDPSLRIYTSASNKSLFYKNLEHALIKSLPVLQGFD